MGVERSGVKQNAFATVCNSANRKPNCLIARFKPSLVNMNIPYNQATHKLSNAPPYPDQCHPLQQRLSQYNTVSTHHVPSTFLPRT